MTDLEKRVDVCYMKNVEIKKIMGKDKMYVKTCKKCDGRSDYCENYVSLKGLDKVLTIY